MEQAIRILHVIGSMNYGGAEALIMNLYRHIDRNLVQFDFVENTDKDAAFDSEIRTLGGRIYNCPHYNGKNHFQYVRWWKTFFREHGGEYTAVHGHLGSTAAIYLQIAKKHGIYTIAHSHNTKGVGLGGSIYQLYSYPTRFIADQFFACSRQAGIDRYGKKVGENPKRCILLSNAIDTGHFAYDPVQRSETRRALGISEEAFVIGHVGRFAPQKNHSFLLDIFSVIHSHHPDARLLLLGLEDPEQSVRKKAAALGLTDWVIFAGTHNDTAPFYQAMDVFVLPSLFEGLPFVMVEAQTAGLPCVISDRVPTACVLVNELVSVVPLSVCAEDWAAQIQTLMDVPRTSCAQIVADSGFDIFRTSSWLTNYYCSLSRSL